MLQISFCIRPAGGAHNVIQLCKPPFQRGREDFIRQRPERGPHRKNHGQAGLLFPPGAQIQDRKIVSVRPQAEIKRRIADQESAFAFRKCIRDLLCGPLHELRHCAERSAKQHAQQCLRRAGTGIGQDAAGKF